MKKNRHKKLYLVVLSLALVVVIGITTSYAFLNDKTASTKNAFTGTQINIGVVEKDKVHEDSLTNIEVYEKLDQVDQTVNKVVTIKNMGGNSYVRVRLIPLIKDDKDQTVAKSVKVNYIFETNTDWKTDGKGTYYYTKELKSGETTDVLLKSVTLKEELPTGCSLELQVLSDAIASRPVKNLETAWGIKDFRNLHTID